jgi:SAM-dependent methyltransferase
MDGHALELDDSQFDMAGSQFGVMLFPDMPKGIREMARVVKSGGQVLVIAYGDPHRIDFLGWLVTAIQAVRPDFTGPPMEPMPLPFQLQDPQRLRHELLAAGLKAVRVETITETTRFQTGNALWQWLTGSNPIVETVLEDIALTSGERTIVERALEQLVLERADRSGFAALSNPINIGIGTK